MNEPTDFLLPLHFLGTGAADHDWANIGSDGVRGSASALLNGNILIDAGVTGFENLSRFGIAPEQLDVLMITHTHNDHFDPAVIGRIISARSIASEPLDIYLSPEGADDLRKALPGQPFSLHPIRSGERICLGNITVTVLPSNHLVNRWEEETFWFLFETPAGNLLYAIDGSWMTTRAASLITPYHLDWIVWDGTMEKSGDIRAFEHSDLDMISLEIKGLAARGNVTPGTTHIITHLARTLWPSEAESRDIASARGFIMAYDGLKLELSKKV